MKQRVEGQSGERKLCMGGVGVGACERLARVKESCGGGGGQVDRTEGYVERARIRRAMDGRGSHGKESYQLWWEEGGSQWKVCQGK